MAKNTTSKINEKEVTKVGLRLFTTIVCPRNNAVIRYEAGSEQGKIVENGVKKYGITIKDDPVSKCYRVKMTRQPAKNEKVFVCTQCANEGRQCGYFGIGESEPKMAKCEMPVMPRPVLFCKRHEVYYDAGLNPISSDNLRRSDATIDCWDCSEGKTECRLPSQLLLYCAKYETLQDSKGRVLNRKLLPSEKAVVCMDCIWNEIREEEEKELARWKKRWLDARASRA